MNLVNSRPEMMNLSFSGCGFLCIYHAGVAAAIKEYAPELLQNKILGASAGSIVACGLITNVCISHATSTILKVVSQARARVFGPLHPEFNLLGIVREELEQILPPNAYEMCTNRLIISLTRWSDHENVVIEEYRSNEDLIDAIMCSCFIPLYCGITPPTFRGTQYIDGGISDNQPIYDEHTVTVSPFSGESDICPPDWDSSSLLGVDFNGTSIRFTARNMFRLMACLWPRSTEDLSKMCLQGFGDALRFLTRNGMAPCIRCLTVQTADPKDDARVSSESLSENDDPKKALAPAASLNRIKKRRSTGALNSFRTRGESECETCGDSDMVVEDVSIHRFFPSVMRKPFENNTPQDMTLYRFFMSFRLVRYAATAMGISKFPFDMGMAFVRRINQYLDIMSPPRWFYLRIRALADFVLGEVQKHQSRYTNFSCLVAVSETDRYGSNLAHSTMEKDELKEIEMSEDAKREMRQLIERDRRRKALKKAGQITPNNSESSLPSTEMYDLDNFEHVINFSRQHDSMYEFHYLDEHEMIRTFGLFTKDKDEEGSQYTSHQPSVCLPTRLNHVPEEDEDAVSASMSCPVTFTGGQEIQESDDKDSGLSGVEMKRNVEREPSTSRRDACCSPVHDFDNQIPVETSSPRRSEKGRSSQRRYAVENMTRKAKRSSSVATSVPQMSSDSEGVDGTEKLFVPSRKAWRASSDFDNKDSTTNHSDTTTA